MLPSRMLHGGIASIWEHNAHLNFVRALALVEISGSFVGYALERSR